MFENNYYFLLVNFFVGNHSPQGPPVHDVVKVFLCDVLLLYSLRTTPFSFSIPEIQSTYALIYASLSNALYGVPI
jgi:hypothetical protein